MKRTRRGSGQVVSRVLVTLACLGSAVLPTLTLAHSASDAYLTLTVEPAGSPRRTVIHGQWDIALRDLDFVSKLDDDGDGKVTWGEVRRHQAAIDQYAYRYLRVESAAGKRCVVTPVRQLIDDHADGAYAALFFDVTCARDAQRLKLSYDLFFAIDPSHRGIFVMNDRSGVATAVLSPQNRTIDLAL